MAKISRRDLLQKSAASAVSLPFSHLLLSTQSGQSAQSPQTPLAPANSCCEHAAAARQVYRLDRSWHFHLGHAADPDKDFGFGGHHRKGAFGDASFTAPAAEPHFDISSWRTVDVPHDWAVELPFLNTPENSAKGSKPLGRYYPETSIGWYRREFSIADSDRGMSFLLEFQGVFRDAIFVLNGHYLGRNFSGYAPWYAEVSDYLNYGGTNVLVVRVDATLSEGWFYEGAGIYRDVTLTKRPAVHLRHHGTYVRSRLARGRATVLVRSEVESDQATQTTALLRYRIEDMAGDPVAALTAKPLPIEARGIATIDVEIPVTTPELWSPDHPTIYRLITSLSLSGATESAGDEETISFGIRIIDFNANRGLLLNGERVKVKGTCNHQDHAGMGVALPDAIHVERVQRLREMGSNACRTSHNPAAPAFLDACDRLGMLVLAETRMFASTAEGLSQLERLILRDRNHPGIFLWSLSNEEPDQGTDRGARIAASMKALVRRLDPDRSVTGAMNNSWGKGVSTIVDVQGFNYAGGGKGTETGDRIDIFHGQHPGLPTIATETASVFGTRGVYADDPARGLVSAYDLNFPSYTKNAEGWWKVLAERQFVAGGFAWTGFDYRGEPVPYSDISVSSQFGIMDACGFPKDAYFYYKSWWGREDTLHLFPHWNWSGREGQPIDVWCYSNLDSVEVLLNGKTFGRQTVPRNGHLQWSVLFEPGSLEARGFRGEKVVLTDSRQTTGSAVRIVLQPRRLELLADGDDVASIAVHVQDAEGRFIPDGAAMIHFRLSGPATILGLGNGDPNSREADKPGTPSVGSRSLFQGLAMLYVQSGTSAGEVTIEASSSGLDSATLRLPLKAAS